MPRTISPNQLLRALNGAPRYVGSISLSTTAATLQVTAGRLYLVQPSADAYLSPATTSAGAVRKQDGTSATITSTLGVKVAADEKFYVLAGDDDGYLAGILASGTGSAQVWELV